MAVQHKTTNCGENCHGFTSLLSPHCGGYRRELLDENMCLVAVVPNNWRMHYANMAVKCKITDCGGGGGVWWWEAVHLVCYN